MRYRMLAAAVVTLAALTGMVAMAEEQDPYVWLEDIHGAKSLAWVAAQNAVSLKALKSDPRYQRDHDAILAVLDATDRIPMGALIQGTVFNFWQDAANPKGVWRRTTVADYANPTPHWEVLLDIDKLSADEKENWVWKGAQCQDSLKACLVTLSRGGGDAHVVREFDLAGKAFRAGGFTLAEAKSSVDWLGDDAVLFATDFGPGSMTASGYPRIVKLWHRGEALDKAKTVYEGKPEDVSVQTQVLAGAGHDDVPLLIRAVDFFDAEYSYIRPDGTVQKLPLPVTVNVEGMTGDQLILTLRKDWMVGGKTFKQGALVSFALKPVLAGAAPAVHELYVPGPRDAVEETSPGRDAVYASIYNNVIGGIHAFYFDAKTQSWSDTKLDLPGAGSTHIISSNDWGSEAYFTFESFLKPTTLYATGGDGKVTPIKALPERFDAADLVTEQFEATSSDGTKIPYFVTRRKDLSGPAPALLYGYGGFYLSQLPWYWANAGKVWTSQGGVTIVANIRGGSEFGPAWHDAVQKAHRQLVFDDFAAVAADAERRGITTPKQLGIMGGSNGGLLVSTVMTQHPELLGAVVCQVPLVDMMAYTHIGAGASWVAEYGDPAIPAERAYILNYSPYQNVRKDKAYPPVFFTTATTDDRVTPVHARKMAARMEEQGHEVLFYENTDGGHGAAANHKQAAEMWALSFVYLKQKLGLK
jgi:prolyl oligopeptidase